MKEEKRILAMEKYPEFYDRDHRNYKDTDLKEVPPTPGRFDDPGWAIAFTGPVLQLKGSVVVAPAEQTLPSLMPTNTRRPSVCQWHSIAPLSKLCAASPDTPPQPIQTARSGHRLATHLPLRVTADFSQAHTHTPQTSDRAPCDIGE
ncbi:UNVERIFIED_CONTAM: hypothetical protein FKN15_027305 [Acipenser sinensis]